MLGLTVQNFLSAATGAAVAIALIRGLVRKNTGELGNFWADIIRCTTRILLPICVVATLLLVSQGVIQNLNPYVDVQTVEGAQQTIAMGPVASQEAIKELVPMAAVFLMPILLIRLKIRLPGAISWKCF